MYLFEVAFYLVEAKLAGILEVGRVRRLEQNIVVIKLASSLHSRRSTVLRWRARQFMNYPIQDFLK